MRAGHVDKLSRRIVAGWAADSDRPDHRLAVSIVVDGQPAGQAVADRLRNDLAGLGRYGDGKHGFHFTFPEPLSETEDHVVTVRYAEDGAQLPNGNQRLPSGDAIAVAVTAAPPPATPAPATPAPPPLPPPLPSLRPPAKPKRARTKSAPPPPPPPGPAGMLPILVTAPGRSGTTLLMSLLARSPAIVAAELVPYELRLLSYYAAAFNVLTAPADLEHSTHPDHLEGDGFHVGFNPFNSAQHNEAFRLKALVQDYAAHFLPDQVGTAIRSLVLEYYGRLAQDKAKPGTRYFAEKGNNLHRPTRLFTRRVFGGIREIVIVRDPRDVLCSHMSYFASSAEKAFNQLSHACRQLLIIRGEQDPNIHTLKYEHMVAGDPACFTALSAFLGTPIEPQPPESGAAVFARHGTSASPEASVERWRSHLPPELRDRCAETWGPFLTAFGYSIT